MYPQTGKKPKALLTIRFLEKNYAKSYNSIPFIELAQVHLLP